MVIAPPQTPSVARSRGSRGRLVVVAVVLLFALDPCRDAEPWETGTGCESDGWHGWIKRRLHPVVGCGVHRVGPSTNRGRVTGLKGSPLRKEQALSEQRVQRRRLRRWETEHVSPTAATRVHHIPRSNPVALLGPAGRIGGQLGGAREMCIVPRRSWALVVLAVVVVVMVAGFWVVKDRVLEGLEGEAEVLSLATGT